MIRLTKALELLESAVNYTMAAAGAITPEMLSYSTPCHGWDLEALLDHLTDSMEAFHEALTTRALRTTRTPANVRPVHDPVARLYDQAERLLAASAAAVPGEHLVYVGDRELSATLVALTGAIEIAVHGWDISVACGTRRSIPPDLAANLLPAAPILIPTHTRPGLFAAPVRLPGPAQPGDHLVAFLGRQPYHAAQSPEPSAAKPYPA